MKEFTIQLEDAEIKALESIGINVQSWVHNAVHARARLAIDGIVIQCSDKNPKKITEMEKFQIVMDAVMPPIEKPD